MLTLTALAFIGAGAGAGAGSGAGAGAGGGAGSGDGTWACSPAVPPSSAMRASDFKPGACMTISPHDTNLVACGYQMEILLESRTFLFYSGFELQAGLRV